METIAKSKKQTPYRRKGIYILPDKSNTYIVILKCFYDFGNDFYNITKTNNIQHYMSLHFDKKILIIKYFVNENNLNIEDILSSYKDNQKYKIQDINVILNMLKTN